MDISRDKQAKSWTWLRKENLKGETEFPLEGIIQRHKDDIKARIDTSK